MAQMRQQPWATITDIGVIEFLNTMAFIKEKDKHEREIMEKQWKKS
jgi:hypothetical protein